ncbi:hypothetical protein [Candidatus Thiosymbion oneisti]|uniref:hypothetical protein n=1 Tax=Candidatus Thiosymbion oneisti TaxID=589554 RepID=UPI000ABE5D37|nr:hypothetical protein [Candidatus Thiosymbion oneisti]
MPRLKPNTLIPTPEEDAAITEAAVSDLDARPFTDEEWEQVKPTLCPERPEAEMTRDAVSETGRIDYHSPCRRDACAPDAQAGSEPHR